MKEELKEILNALEDCYFDELSEEDFYDNVIWYFKEKYKKPFTYDHGASKLAIIFEKLGFVIKIPFMGSYENSDYDDETDEYYGGDFYSFDGADSDNSWDYCATEAERYEEAKSCGIEQCFAKTERLTEIKNHPIYIQEYVHIYDYGESSIHTEEDTNKVKTMCSNNDFNCFNEDWLSDVFSYFGEEIFYKFMDFINYMGINDLHCGNLGYINRKPVLFDYSGWDN